LLAARCSFLAPRILFERDDGNLDVRAMVPGSADPWRIYAKVREDAELATRLGKAIGSILVEQHTRIVAADVADWLPPRPEWPEPSAWIRARLPRVVDDPELVARASDVLDAYEAVEVTDADRVLVHGDVGFHNLGIDPDTHEVHGIYDYEGAAWADRHHDFRYLVFDLDRDEVADAARAVYEPAVGLEIRPDRIRLYNAACALSFLAFRDGTPPEERSCGRTLAEDLRWTSHALARIPR
jgi:aminoglycoside phosphotransferase (APT) family kinase protein